MSQLHQDRGHRPQRKRFVNQKLKAFKSFILEIYDNTFNMGESKYAAQFNQSKINIAWYLQRQYPDEGYRVAQAVRTGEEQTIKLPDKLADEKKDDKDKKVLEEIAVKAVGKQCIQLSKDLKRAYAVVYKQCSQERTNLQPPLDGIK